MQSVTRARVQRGATKAQLVHRAKRRPKPVQQPEPTPWDRLQSHLATYDLDDGSDPAIPEALTLLKHAGPELHRVQPLTVALGLLLAASARIAAEWLLIEENLATACNLLHEHIADTCGLLPGEGRWEYEPRRSGEYEPLTAQLYAATFPPRA